MMNHDPHDPLSDEINREEIIREIRNIARDIFAHRDLFFLDPGDPEWEAAWLQLGVMYESTTDECPCCGEVWQYMGSWLQEDGSWKHTFRHRHLPQIGQRINVEFPATYGWTPDRPADEEAS
jgi:hypothetical protein